MQVTLIIVLVAVRVLLRVLQRVEATSVILRSGSTTVRVELPERRGGTSSAHEPRTPTPLAAQTGEELP